MMIGIGTPRNQRRMLRMVPAPLLGKENARLGPVPVRGLREIQRAIVPSVPDAQHDAFPGMIAPRRTTGREPSGRSSVVPSKRY